MHGLLIARADAAVILLRVARRLGYDRIDGYSMRAQAEATQPQDVAGDEGPGQQPAEASASLSPSPSWSTRLSALRHERADALVPDASPALWGRDPHPSATDTVFRAQSASLVASDLEKNRSWPKAVGQAPQNSEMHERTEQANRFGRPADSSPQKASPGLGRGRVRGAL